MRIALLFKDGITRPAAAISAPIVIESVRVECTGEGVCTPPKIIQFATSRQVFKGYFHIPAAWRSLSARVSVGRKLDGRRNLIVFNLTENSSLCEISARWFVVMV